MNISDARATIEAVLHGYDVSEQEWGGPSTQVVTTQAREALAFLCSALEEARRENEGLRLGNSRVRDNYEARFVAQQAERDRLRAALYEREEALRAIEAMRDDAPLAVARNIARAALSNPTATTEEP